MNPEVWVDLFKWLAALCVPMGVIYAGAVKYFDIIRSRPAPDEATPKMLAAILNKITDSLEKDAVARLGRMQEISSVLEKLAALQLGIAEGSIKSQNVTETLHKMTRDQIGHLGALVGPGLERIEANQVMINKTIERFGNALSGRPG